ncbi:MAG: hypothetical protein KDA78_11945 [Planctomycetaceae bacterium]|nr:hypothetical protein [Planctomycetaceae bacterium]
MAASVTEMSVADIQSLLKEKQSKVRSLTKKREKLLQQLADIDNQIKDLSGGAAGARFKNDKSLEQYIVDALKKNKKGLTLAELASAIKDAGYQSSSSNFKNVVYQNLYNSDLFKRDSKSSRYVLA